MTNAILIPGDSPAARIAAFPGMLRVPSAKLELFICRNFLDPASCASLIDMIDANSRPSTIVDTNGDYGFRTSETCDLDGSVRPVAQLAARLAQLSGIDPANAEPMQGQRYAPGQEFKAHTDYFEPNGSDYATYCTVSGQRTWTIMLYLNAVEAGGATRFKNIDKLVQPEPGKLLAWNNRLSDGGVNPATLHHGMKVRKGTKYIITQWFRERPWG